jgi:hypothetical protein
MRERNLAAIIGSTEEWGIINVLAPEAALAAEEERRAKNAGRCAAESA